MASISLSCDSSIVNSIHKKILKCVEMLVTVPHFLCKSQALALVLSENSHTVVAMCLTPFTV